MYVQWLIKKYVIRKTIFNFCEHSNLHLWLLSA